MTQTKLSSAKVKGECIRTEERYRHEKFLIFFRGALAHSTDVIVHMSLNHSNKCNPRAWQAALWYQEGFKSAVDRSLMVSAGVNFKNDSGHYNQSNWIKVCNDIPVIILYLVILSALFVKEQDPWTG